MTCQSCSIQEEIFYFLSVTILCQNDLTPFQFVIWPEYFFEYLNEMLNFQILKKHTAIRMQPSRVVFPLQCRDAILYRNSTIIQSKCHPAGHKDTRSLSNTRVHCSQVF